MNREELIKYGLIVLLGALIVFILLRVVNINDIKTLFVKEKFNSDDISKFNQQPRPAQPVEPVVEAPKNNDILPIDESTEILGFSDDSNFSNLLAGVPASENGPSVNFKACDLNKVSPEELLPSGDTEFGNLNPVLNGGLKNKNFLEAGAHIGLDTIGQSLRNANYQLRADPPNPKMNVGPWNNTTIEADPARRPLE